MSIHSKLAYIQSELNAPKNQYNSFGKYKYRSCEDILQAVKPLLANSLTLTISDDIIEVGGRIYVKATATLSDGKEEIKTTALAREPENKKGMDSSQITGAASSYARKYALNGLFAIDDNKDADTKDNRKEGKIQPKKAKKKVTKEQYAELCEWMMEENTKQRQKQILENYVLTSDQTKEIKSLA
jgi:hypothetical protein